MSKSPILEHETLIGLYIHQHWPYNYPYAARTWSVDDYRGFLGGLRQIGYDMAMIWPMLETMPEPLTPSDEAYLRKLAQAIDMAHGELGMKVWLCLCPNVTAVNEIASRMPFEERHFFYCDARANPADSEAMARMIRWREKLLRPLAAVDAIVTIDSDPGGWPGSTNAEFVNLLARHREMYDRLRPEIEIYYWAEHGWPTYCRFYESGYLDFENTERAAEFGEAFRLLDEAGLEPWGVAGGRPYQDKIAYAREVDIADRVIAFNYGSIEGEPSFPMTNWWFDAAYEAGADRAPRGCMGNAQTHGVQLPNIFAFAMGATGKPKDESLVVDFADQLIPGLGALIVDAWKSMGGDDQARMRELSAQLVKAGESGVEAGPLSGLLFGKPKRFLSDLVMMLNVQASWREVRAALDGEGDPWGPLEAFVTAAERWQVCHGYQNSWWWPDRDEILAKLTCPAINALLGNDT
ncbi:MAG: hypothetical protein GWP08_06450, partial [Nitrospiraceae bacterium]|nr:hypothetical protein [Nitrospiraceae bacterium]